MQCACSKPIRTEAGERRAVDVEGWALPAAVNAVREELVDAEPDVKARRLDGGRRRRPFYFELGRDRFRLDLRDDDDPARLADDAAAARAMLRMLSAKVPPDEAIDVVVEADARWRAGASGEELILFLEARLGWSREDAVEALGRGATRPGRRRAA